MENPIPIGNDALLLFIRIAIIMLVAVALIAYIGYVYGISNETFDLYMFDMNKEGFGYGRD